MPTYIKQEIIITKTLEGGTWGWRGMEVTTPYYGQACGAVPSRPFTLVRASEHRVSAVCELHSMAKDSPKIGSRV